MKDKRQKKLNQRAKRKAKTKAFFARKKLSKLKQHKDVDSFRKNWTAAAKEIPAQKRQQVFDKNAWNIGSDDGRAYTSLD